MDLRSVLQAIVDALCDHTPWQLCFVYGMDTQGGFGEIAARRDRIDYTTRSRQERWPFPDNPAVVALTRNEIIAIPNVADAEDYPQLQATAAKGIVASAYVPLSSRDPQGRPMVLSVQSTKPVLADETQIPFLRAVASLASLAATTAGLLSEARHAAARGAENAATLSAMIDGVSAGVPTSDLLSEVERRTGHAVVVLDHVGAVAYLGRAPHLEGASDAGVTESWADVVAAHRSRWVELVAEAFHRNKSATATVTLLPRDARLTATATRYGRGDAVITVITIPVATQQADASVGAAVALVMIRDRIQSEAQLELQNDVISQLLNRTFHDFYELRTRAAHVGLNLDEPAVLVVASAESEAGSVRVSGALRLQAKHWPGAAIDNVDGLWVFLLPMAGSTEGRAAAFVESVNVSTFGATAGVTLTVTRSGLCARPEDYAEEWARCLRALDLAGRLGRSGVIRTDEFGAYRLLLPALEHGDLQEFITAALGPVLTHDREHQSDLFDTIEAFTNLSGRFNEAARILMIHVSTLRYRLQKIETLLGRSLANPDVRFDLLLAARLERLRRGSPSPAELEHPSHLT